MPFKSRTVKSLSSEYLRTAESSLELPHTLSVNHTFSSMSSPVTNISGLLPSHLNISGLSGFFLANPSNYLNSRIICSRFDRASPSIKCHLRSNRSSAAFSLHFQIRSNCTKPTSSARVIFACERSPKCRHKALHLPSLAMTMFWQLPINFSLLFCTTSLTRRSSLWRMRGTRLTSE